jgi:flagellar basal-body rod protein FlgB
MNDTLSVRGGLTRLLDVCALRHRVIAQNVANVDTPGYHRLEVAFEDDLSAATGRPEVVASDAAPTRPDGNNVSIEQEMTDLNKNALLYQTAVQLLATRIAAYRSAVAGR